MTFEQKTNLIQETYEIISPLYANVSISDTNAALILTDLSARLGEGYLVSCNKKFNPEIINDLGVFVVRVDYDDHHVYLLFGKQEHFAGCQEIVSNL